MRIVREYEMLVESAGMSPAVVMSSTLAALALLDDRRATMLARVSGSKMTTAIVRDGVLCGYRCSELASDWPLLTSLALHYFIFLVDSLYHVLWLSDI